LPVLVQFSKVGRDTPKSLEASRLVINSVGGGGLLTFWKCADKPLKIDSESSVFNFSNDKGDKNKSFIVSNF
jgi:hypothetical protein